MWQFAGPDNYTSNTLLDFNLVQPLLRARRAHARAGAAHDFRAGAAGERAADGALSPRVLFERRHRPRSGPGAEPPRRFVRRQRFGRFQRRRRRRLRPRRRRRRRQFSGRASDSPAALALSRPAATSACCKRRRSFAINTRTSPALGDSLEQLQAAYDAGRIDRFQVDLARQALYNAQSQLLNSQNDLRRRRSTTSSCSTACRRRLTSRSPIRCWITSTCSIRSLSALQIRVTDVLTVLREGSQAADAGRRAGRSSWRCRTQPPPDSRSRCRATDFASLVAAELPS